MQSGSMTHHQTNSQHGQAPPAPIRKPPRKNPYRDGISKSNQYYDLYDAIRYPNRAKANQPPVPPCNSQRPLSKQKLIEKKIEEKFKKNHYTVANDKLKIFGKVIKFIFLIVTVPIYMFLYRLPRWLFVQWLPKIIKKINNYFTSLEKRALNYFKKCCTRLTFPFVVVWRELRSFGTDEKATIKEQDIFENKGFFAFISQGISFILKFFVLSLIQLYKTLKKAIIFTKSLPKKGIKNIANIFKKISEYPHKLFYTSIKLLKSMPMRLTLYVKNYFINGVKNIKLAWQKKIISLTEKKDLCFCWFQQKKDILKAKCRTIFENLKKHFNYLSFLTKKVMLSFRVSFIKIKSILNSQIERIQHFFYTLIQQRKRLDFSRLKLKVVSLEKVLIKIFEKFPDKYKVVKCYLEDKFEKQKALVVFKLAQKRDPLQNFINSTKKPLLFARRVKNVIQRSFISLSERIKNQLSLKLMFFKPLIKVSRELACFLGRGLLYLTNIIKIRCSLWVDFCHHKLSFLVLKIRIGIAWGHVFLRYGIILVGQTAQEIGWF
jgi:hypothetical protein